MKKNLIFLWIILAGFLLFSCNQKKTAQKSERKLPVSVIKAQPMTKMRKVNIFGKIYPEKSVKVYPKIPGEIKEILVQQGESVRKGQILARIQQIVPGSRFAPSPINAPISAVVLNIFTDVGNSLSPQTPIMELGDIGCLIFRGQVFGNDRGKVKKDQKLVLHDKLSGEDINMMIQRISPVIDEISGGLTIEAKLCFGEKRVLLPGLTIDGYIELGKISGFSIPRTALVNQNKKEGVFLFKQGKAVFKEITVLYSDEEHLLVKEELQDEQIIFEGAQGLSAGDSVRIVETKSIQE